MLRVHSLHRNTEAHIRDGGGIHSGHSTRRLFCGSTEKVAKDTYAQLDKLYKEKLPKLAAGQSASAKRQKTEIEPKKGENTKMGI